jgi:hypothetical protein
VLDYPTIAREWLAREDEVCREGRLERLEWLARRMPISEYLGFPGGWIAKCLFEEARYCFAYGQFVATVMLGLSYIEHTLAAILYAFGRSDLERANISVLFREAAREGWLTDTEFAALEEIRRLRNPLAHFRKPLADGTIERRSFLEGELPYAVLEEDAKKVMEAAVHLLGSKRGLTWA